MVLPVPVVWQMLEQLQSDHKDHALEVAMTEIQDTWQEHDFLRSVGVGAVAVGRVLIHRDQALATTRPEL